MVEGKMMKVGTKLRRIPTFSPINFPMKFSLEISLETRTSSLAIEEYFSKKVSIRDLI